MSRKPPARCNWQHVNCKKVHRGAPPPTSAASPSGSTAPFGVEVEFTAPSSLVSMFEKFKAEQDGDTEAAEPEWTFQPRLGDPGPMSMSDWAEREAAPEAYRERRMREWTNESTDLVTGLNAESRAARQRDTGARLAETAAANTDPANLGAELADALNDVEMEREKRRMDAMLDWMKKNQQ